MSKNQPQSVLIILFFHHKTIYCLYHIYSHPHPYPYSVEGGETAVKLARRWGYDVKGIPEGEARVLFADNNCKLTLFYIDCIRIQTNHRNLSSIFETFLTGDFFLPLFGFVAFIKN